MFLAAKKPGMSLDGKFVHFPTPGLTIWAIFSRCTHPNYRYCDRQVVKSFSTDLGAQSVHITPLCTIMVGKYSFDPEAPATAPRARAGRSALCSLDMYALLGEVVVELAPLTMRSTVDGKTAFVANIFSWTVTIVDLTSMTVIRTLNIGNAPNPAK